MIGAGVHPQTDRRAIWFRAIQPETGGQDAEERLVGRADAAPRGTEGIVLCRPRVGSPAHGVMHVTTPKTAKSAGFVVSTD